MAELLGDDISRVMCKRALAGYGLQSKDNVGNNSAVLRHCHTVLPCGGVEALCGVWEWLGRARALSRAATYRLKTGVPYNYHGILPLLSQSNLRSDIFNKPWYGLDTPPTGSKHTTRVFRSEERTLCLQLLSWLPLHTSLSNNVTTMAMTQHNTLDEAIEAALALGQHCRAAALAVFQLHLPRAIDILRTAAGASSDVTLNAVAMALAGYSGDRKALWRSTCAGLLASLQDPHLRAIFAFLTGEGDSYTPLLVSGDLGPCDQLGFAITFLSDVRLLEFLEQLKLRLATVPPDLDLRGLMVTGLHEVHGLALLSNYMDHTSDVQTTALLAIHGFSHTVGVGDGRLQLWVESYQQFLASQQLWEQRAQLLVLRPPQHPPQHVLLACNYCMKSIAASHLAHPNSPPKNQLARLPPPSSQQQQNKSKIMSCPHCRKPLPRCALCLQHLGTPSLSPAMLDMHHGHKAEKFPHEADSPHAPHHLFVPAQTQARLRDSLPGLNPFASWFTWCQTCRHGGHANHVIDWFTEHTECPVTGCKCECLLQDNITQQQRSNTSAAPASSAAAAPTMAPQRAVAAPQAVASGGG